MRRKGDIIRTTCPRDCYDSCGIIAILDQDGGLKQLVGDPDHHMAQGRLCPKCALAYNGAWRDPTMRLHTPLKRSGPKGAAQYEAVTWDDALSDIAARLSEIAESDSAARIYHTHYTGTCAVLGGMFPLRFFKRLGATEVEPDTVCNNAAHASLTYTFGESLEGFDPDTIGNSASVLVWGANPSFSAPHVETHWLGKTDAKVIVIDPIAHPSARAADMHLQLRPGSDAALAFGLLHIARRDGHIDYSFLENHTVGWEEVLPDVEAATPSVTAELTGLTAGQIEKAAALYTSGPSLIWLGQGLQRQRTGGNVYQVLRPVVRCDREHREIRRRHSIPQRSLTREARTSTMWAASLRKPSSHPGGEPHGSGRASGRPDQVKSADLLEQQYRCIQSPNRGAYARALEDEGIVSRLRRAVSNGHDGLCRLCLAGGELSRV